MEYTFYAKGIGDEILADYEGQVEFDETKMPVFDADNDDFTLTLYNLNYGHNYIMNVNDIQGDNRIDTQDGAQGGIQDGTQDGTQDFDTLIMNMIEENNKISAKIMAEKLGVSLRTVRRLIKENDQIEYVGHGFSGYWKIK